MAEDHRGVPPGPKCLPSCKDIKVATRPWTEEAVARDRREEHVSTASTKPRLGPCCNAGRSRLLGRLGRERGRLRVVRHARGEIEEEKLERLLLGGEVGLFAGPRHVAERGATGVQ